MEMEIRVEKEKMARFCRVCHKLQLQISMLEEVQRLYHQNRIDFSTFEKRSAKLVEQQIN